MSSHDEPLSPSERTDRRSANGGRSPAGRYATTGDSGRDAGDPNEGAGMSTITQHNLEGQRW
jgi:hypothetical protein